MSDIRQWYDALPPDVAGLVRSLVAVAEPTDEQLAEAPDIAEGYAIEAMELDDEARRRLVAAIDDLQQRMQQTDPRHRFLREHADAAMADRLRGFYEDEEYAQYQHAQLVAAYASKPLFVDFDMIADLINPDFTAESIGAQYVEFADLKYAPDEAPGECSAHLAIDPETTTVYLLEPSGSPEHIADDLDEFIAKLKPGN